MLEAWYGWFNKTQKETLPGSYRFRTQNELACLLHGNLGSKVPLCRTNLKAYMKLLGEKSLSLTRYLISHKHDFERRFIFLNLEVNLIHFKAI
jgi:hypothetical protein